MEDSVQLCRAGSVFCGDASCSRCPSCCTVPRRSFAAWLQIQADRGESDDTRVGGRVPEGWRSVGPSRYQGDLRPSRSPGRLLCVTIEHDVESAAEAPPNASWTCSGAVCAHTLR